ncbi:nitrate reductase molybdenum cofactor assembly chaperone [Streptomyces sp. UG1]|uniref:nitrate reductase molybdenum cofactor assembly chaperone n=1 Tax=Streptomyces sp. UG1 TaxID=3417652 RepID=UPI003CF62ABD
MSPLPTTVPAIVRTRVRAAVRRPARLTPEEAEARALLLRLCSLLLQYPDAELSTARPVLVATVDALPPSPAAGHLAAFTSWLADQEPEALERHYVEMFDLRRKSSLYLTYYLHGDTRRRGMALLTLAQRYRAAVWDTDGGELPDHLPVVLEFHRALIDADSPYRHVLAALITLLPPPTEADLLAVAELAAQGPPNEDVGLDPYGAGEFAPPGAFVPPEQAPPTLARPADPHRQEDR